MRLQAIKLFIIFSLFIGFAYPSIAAELSNPCKTISYQTAQFSFCVFHESDDIRLFLNATDGQPYRDFNAVAESLDEGEVLKFGMNGGMYHEDRSPVGLYIEHGQKITPLNLNSGLGNFYMLPNGVFVLWQEDGYRGAYVLPSDKYSKIAEDVISYATQSGPMLVIDGQIHPKFNMASNSLRIRNGVGKTKDGKIIFVKSETAVNFYTFASFFRDELETPYALYLDGTISRMYDSASKRNDAGQSMGPIIAVIQTVPSKAPKGSYE